ncbi:hypothetical protein A2165_00060 [Candidatus Curtissbacteria bacterium RBG_13_40_7]|uniref:Excinuclease ABC subunit C n=1 Tax=Candidatus Curtissbacteria bacterium RBG_13_40_7 TaxID=1797706 RepID=A0A1F5FXQ2_9BACT|nr:MAG: hypothetical protein A2165_00060 [Candidatus Curtissbacteria bacterium RBG_13_40_7]
MISSDLEIQTKKLPDSAGVYIFYDKNGKILYVGKSVSIRKRVTSYFTDKQAGPKTNLLIQNIRKVNYIKAFSEFEALLLEADIIRRNQPFFNIQWKDDKSSLYIKIEGKPVPLITTIRKPHTPRGVFVKGPFPSAVKTREVLRLIRRIFPFCHHKNPKRPCLYVHLGLCPYPYSTEPGLKNYQNSIRKIKKLLMGQTKPLLRSLYMEMKIFSKKMEYEKAQAVKKQIENIEYLLRQYHAPQEFLSQPTLVEDLILAKLEDLKERLSLRNLPKRIECYDISNIAAKFATGSMSVFANGQPDKKNYRRFKIIYQKKPNDYEMIREVLKRRLKNKWPMADLIVIDGGKGHLNVALSELAKNKKYVPVIAIAKKLETIYAWNKIAPINLPKDSPSKQLVQALRDEAHRFAISYHRLLRSKYLLNSMQ